MSPSPSGRSSPSSRTSRRAGGRWPRRSGPRSWSASTGSGLEILEELVRLAHDTHRAELDQAVAAGEDPAEFAAASGDLVIWDANRIVAILRALPDGSLEDNRFSRTGFLTDPCERAGIPGKGGAL